ncbi:MAG: Lipid A export ATP-binding/permease protein MsbA [Brockia lithotrophica]|uniref:Lipid A export ATP-binding/permease protein MsbA n=1 Tax=Brockia lithotrophica TaxID=933949 RepID=A0A2T5G943_9BACL|nr:MAG: Lipid A export ATP-binding/permease protein MsbA [Brockia lithotrophica]
MNGREARWGIRGLLGRAWREERRSYLWGAGFLFLVDLVTLLPPVLVGQAVDRIVTGTVTRAFLVRTVLALVAVALSAYGLRYLWRRLLFLPAYRIGARLRAELFAHLLRLGPSFFSRRRRGDLLAYFANDVEAVEQALSMGVLTLLDSVVMGGLLLAALVGTSAPLALVALVPMPLLAWVSRRLGDLLYRRFDEAQDGYAALSARVEETVRGMEVLRAYGQRGHALAAFARAARDVAHKGRAALEVDALYYPVIGGLTGLSFFLALSTGSFLVARGVLTYGELAAFLAYLGQFVWPMLALGYLFNLLERGAASYDRIGKILERQPEIVDAPDALREPPSGRLVFSSVTYRYPEADVPSLEDVSFAVEEGEILAILGPSGAGKSTLLRLVLREIEPVSGEVTWGGIPLRRYALATLRASVGYVAPEPVVFRGTIAENLALGKGGASREELERVARLVDLHEEILRLPAEYDTRVGPDGVRLSGGQAARLALARALLVDPPLFLFDDPLASVDVLTELRIWRRLLPALRGKTVLLVTHRLLVLPHVNRIVILRQGRVAAWGTHAELVATYAPYRRLFRAEEQLVDTLLEGERSRTRGEGE